MTTPLGVPNLPTGALTVSTLGQRLQDQTVAAMRGRAGERVPSIFNSSTGGNLQSELTPFGIITKIWAQVNSLIALADPADINGPEDIPALLINFIENLPVVGQFVELLEAFTGQYTGDDEILQTIQTLFAPIVELATKVVELLTGAPGALDDLKKWAEDLPLVGSIVSVLTGDAEGPKDLAALGVWARSLLSGNSKIPAENLIGQISDAVFSVIPVAHINAVSPNLLSQGEFFSLATINPGNGWTWDDTENRTGKGGSAKVTANSTLRELFSNQSIKVAEGDKVTVSAWIKTSGYAGSGSPIVLSVVPFAGTTQQSTVTIASRGASTSWVQMSNSGSVYVVPAGVTSIRVCLAVTATATGGSVYWDDISVTKTGLLGQTLVDSLVAAWNKLWDGAFGLTGTVGKTWEDLNTALANPLGKANTANTNHATLLGNLLNLPATVIGSIVNVIVDGAASMGQFLTDLFDGLNGSTGSSNKTVSNVKSAAGTTRSQANLGVTNAATAQGAATTADGKAQGAIDGINQAVTGATGTGATAGTVVTNMTALKATPTNLLNSLISGYTVETINQNVSPKTWTKPAGITELYVVLFGAGANGSSGQTYAGTGGGITLNGGNAGAGGAVIALQIDPTSVPSSVTVTIGTPASPDSSFGTIVSTADAYAAYVATPLGLLPTANAATTGGKGGGVSAVSFVQTGATGSPGSNTTAGVAGGTGGTGSTVSNANSTGTTGGSGGGGINFGLCQTGGAGGGGGGGAAAIGITPGSATGGKGGAGGFPGGGGGGGGAAYRSSAGGTVTAGAGGSGGNGVALIIYKIAKTTA